MDVLVEMELNNEQIAHLFRCAKDMPTIDEMSVVESLHIGPHGSISVLVKDVEGDLLEFVWDPYQRWWSVVS